MNDVDKIKLKIKALLSKTIENGATKEEMDSALSKATQLMKEHFISSFDLKDSEIKNKCISKSFDLTKSGFDLGIFYADLSQLFDCKHYYSGYTITFFGHEQDVEMCGYFYSLITRTCLAEKDLYLKSDECKLLSKEYHGKTLACSFIKGFMIQVSIKMRQMYYDRESNIPKSYGLAIIDKRNKVDNEFSNLNMKIRKSKNKPLIAERKAFDSGIVKGNSVNLSVGIEHKESLKLA